MVRIERALDADVPAMTALLHELFAVERDFSASRVRQVRGLELLLAMPPERAVALVARSEGAVVGMTTGQLVVSTAEGAPSLWIEDVVVAASSRGQGVGRALLRGVLEWGARQGATRAQLLADQRNEAALAFYGRIGWSRSNMVMLRTSL